MDVLSTMGVYPVLVAAVAGMVLGALWYSPLLFGDQWLRAIGKSQAELGAPLQAMLGSMFAALIAAVAVEYLVVATESYSLLSGATIGALLGVAIVATSMLSDALFSGWGWRLYLI
ncbi:hypothetical protein BOW53_09970 [Solemya pervernicosa gill symbiont]|uniref:DUF1761 domain-containing protein n=2 Tax=Gammaproteobacteria incertae sedis TaxID=118884 RepID=A0A1T2L442_9GAMM|nr:DUF1761 domain-containing protein [Candidatus Reidiella endopervernicosa]OOZ39842.1 hypothetical protein BOW53_09970 [Solemya pervernicosa gill symbiont]QKQ27485.1 DUF1761 domain-containing protein [Candidatus Reidiella endopervernicosa]